MFGHDWGMGWMGFMPRLWMALIVAAIYFLTQSGARAGTHRHVQTHKDKEHKHCPQCGAVSKSGWKVCPYCGTPIDWSPDGNSE